MRSIVLLSVMLLTLGGSQPPVCAETPTPLPTKLDHILLWGRSISFIDYTPSCAMQTSVADDRIVRTNPNGANALSAF